MPEQLEENTNGAPAGGNQHPLAELAFLIRSLKPYKKVLTSEEVNKLMYRMRRGDKKARMLLINHNMRFVIAVAKNYQNRGVSLSDLIQDGVMGLMTAVERFDPKRGFRFSTYAGWWIRQAISRALAGTSRMIRIPVYLNEEHSKVHRVRKEFLAKTGYEPKQSYISRKTKLSRKKIKEILAYKPTVSLDEEHMISPDGDDGQSLYGSLPVNILDPAEKLTITLLFADHINQIIKSLEMIRNPRNALVFSIRYGINDLSFQLKTLAKVGKLFKVSRERVRQIEYSVWKQLGRKYGDKVLFLKEGMEYVTQVEGITERVDREPLKRCVLQCPTLFPPGKESKFFSKDLLSKSRSL